MTLRLDGFSLLEALLVVALLAILASIALPSYAGFVTRSRILDAVAQLSDVRARMEQHFLDERTYVDDTGACGVPPPAARAEDSFSITCEATAATFVYTASGIAAKGMAGFAYSIDQAGAKATVSVPGGWSRTLDCWTVRPDGLCV